MDEFSQALREFDAQQSATSSPQTQPAKASPSRPKPAAAPSSNAPGAPPSPGKAGGSTRSQSPASQTPSLMSRLMASVARGVTSTLDFAAGALPGVGGDRLARKILGQPAAPTVTSGLNLDAASLAPQSRAEGFAQTAGEIAGGSIIPVAGLYGRGAYLLRTAGPGALTATRGLAGLADTAAVETAARPLVAAAAEGAAALTGAAGGEAAQEIFPDNEMARTVGELAGSLIGGGLGAAGAGRLTKSAVGMDVEGHSVVGWSGEADDAKPILKAKPVEETPNAESPSKAPSGEPADETVTLTAEPPRPEAGGHNGAAAEPGGRVRQEADRGDGPAGAGSTPQLAAEAVGEPLGTIGRKELTNLQDEVAQKLAHAEELYQGAAKAAMKGDNSPATAALQGRHFDITWESAAEAAAKVGEFRIGQLGADSDGTAALLSALYRQLPEKSTRSDADLMRAVGAYANEIGTDPETMLAIGKTIAGELGNADVGAALFNTFVTRQAAEVNQLYLAKVNWAEASEDLVDHALGEIYKTVQLGMVKADIKTGLGRGLRSLQLPDFDTYVANARQTMADSTGVPPLNPREMPPLPRTREELKDWMDLWGMTDGDPAKQMNMLEGLLTVPAPGKYLRQSFANFFTASILSAPRTVALNVVGPGVLSLYRNVARLAGGAEMAISPLATASERAAGRAVMAQTAKAYIQTFGDIQDAFKMALRSAEVNHTLVGGGGQTLDSTTTFGPLTENMLAFAGQEPSMAYSLGNMINMFPKAFARVNNGLDEFAKRLAYNGELRANALVEGATGGLKGAELEAAVNARVRNGYDAVGKATDEALLRSAERTTLTSSVGEEGSYLRGFSNRVQKLRSSIPESRFILPVFNVPMNALGETMASLPIARIPGLNSALFKHTAAELRGEMGPVAQAEAHGRTMLGAAFLMAGYQLNHAGILTGAGPQQPTDRKVWLQTHQPYSIKINGDWVNYSKFDILGGLLAIPSTAGDLTTYNPNDQAVMDHVWAGVGSLAQWFKDRAALKTATDLLNFGGDPTQDPGNVFERTTGSIAAGFFPAAIRTTVTDPTQPYQVMKTSWDDYIQSAIPGWANGLEPARNVIGEPIRKAADTFGEALVPVSLVKAIGYDDDPVLDELDRLYQTTGYGAGADSKSLSHGYFVDKDVQLEDGVSMYSHFMQARQTMELGGKTLRQSLTGLFNSDAYNKAVDGDSERKATSRGERSRGYMVREVFQRYNKAIKAEMAAASPKAKAYLTAAEAKVKDDAYLRDVSVEDLVADPSLYRAHGVYEKGYEETLMKGSTGALVEALRK